MNKKIIKVGSKSENLSSNSFENIVFSGNYKQSIDRVRKRLKIRSIKSLKMKKKFLQWMSKIIKLFETILNYICNRYFCALVKNLHIGFFSLRNIN